jgi:TetR/AcrR family transcriptional regulator, transcriptional repressor for nem operon
MSCLIQSRQAEDRALPMGHSQKEKAANHRRILHVTARRLREHGLDKVTVADLMRDAGLTHGGFYKHFASRDELLREAVSCAFAEAKARLAVDLADVSGTGLEAYLEVYLTKDHRDRPGDGCPVAALATEVARTASAREVFDASFRGYANWIAGMLAGQEDGKRGRGAAIICAVAGAIAVSRALQDEAFSSEMLEATRKLILDAEATSARTIKPRTKGRKASSLRK